jgi:hypothetical protein
MRFEQNGAGSNAGPICYDETMTERARRTIVICRVVALAALAAGVIATFHFGWLYPVMMAFIVAALQSNQILLTYAPLRYPSFDERVQGEILSGTSADEARQKMSAEFERRGILFSAVSVVAVLCIALAAYGRSPSDSWFSALFAHAALWIVGIGVVGVVLPLVALAFGPNPLRRSDRS